MQNVLDVATLGSAGFAINGPSAYTSLGHSVAIAGDINGDGFDDVIVSAPYGSFWSTGASYVIFGHAGMSGTIDTANLDASAGFVLQGAAGDYSGFSVSGAGDINGDGFDDLIIGGAWGYYGFSSGNTYVVYGHSGDFADIDFGQLSASEGFIIQDTGNMGHVVSPAGDVNGDGIDDILIGSSTGSDYVIFGSTSGFGTINLTAVDASSGFAISGTTSLGYRVSAAGDVNGDGFDDVVVSGTVDSKAVTYVIYGHAGDFSSVDVTNLSAAQGFEITTSSGAAWMNVAGAGDFDGDGLADLLIGIPVDATYAGPGSAYIVYGQTTGHDVDLDLLSASTGLVLTGASATDYAGTAVAGAGDINRDGFDDVVVGGLNDGVGQAYVVYGRPDGAGQIDLGTLQASDGFVVQGDATDYLGLAVSGNGDVNGDGYADIIIGAPNASSTAQGAGAAYVIYGTATPLPQIIGTDAGETLTGTTASEYFDGLGGNDVILGMGGNDLLHGGSGNDRLDGGVGIDKMYGGTGDDLYIVRDSTDYAIENAGEGTDRVVSYVNLHLRANLENLALAGSSDIWGYGNELDNVLIGNSGANKLFGLSGNDVLDGKAGADLMAGGIGNDRYYVDDYGDRVVENAGEGADSVFSSSNFRLGANVEDLTLTGSADLWAYANELGNRLTGNSGGNKLFGMGGDDTIKGGGGNDWIDGGAGRDMLYGGAGSDTFVFSDGDLGGATPATADRIVDFVQAEDLIRLKSVDANSTLTGDQAFHFIGTAAFDGTAGELRYQEISGATYVSGDTDGDGTADFMVRVDGLHTLTSSDFVL